MLRQNGKLFYKGLYVTFKLAPDLRNNTAYLSSYIPLNEGHVSILTNSMLRIYTSDIDERIILRFFLKIYSYTMILCKLRKSGVLLLNYNESFSLESPYVCK